MSRYIDADKLKRHGSRGGLVHWKDIEEAPTVDVEPIRHGEWIEDDDKCYWKIVCSECEIEIGSRTRIDTEKMNYCPYCGAKMDEEE